MPFFSLILLILILFENISSDHQIIQVNLGQTVTLSCLFDPEKIDQISFMRQMTGDILSVGRELFIEKSSSNDRIELKEISSNRLDLKFLSINENDSGMYTCMFNDEKLSSFLIQILIPPRFVSYFPIEGNLFLTEHSSMNLSCQAFAIPSANITWIYRDIHKQSKNIHNGNNVYIPSIRSSDSGSYECIASNQIHASISRSFYVTVQYSPHVTMRIEESIYQIHQTVFLHCQICAIPNLIQINWFRDEQILIDVNIIIKNDFIQQNQCYQSILEIVDISEYQFGRYECRGENILGKNSSFIDVKQMDDFQNGRTALLIDNEEKKINVTSTPQWLSDHSSPNTSSQFSDYYSLIIISIIFLIDL